MTDSIRVLLLATAMASAAGLAGARDHGQRGALEMFERFDLDGDGAVTAEELDNARIAKFVEVDGNGDGTVSEAEFVEAARARAEDRARANFARMDADGDGFLTLDTLAAARRGPHSGMIERLDTDGDGAITLEEFEEARAARSHRWGRRHGEDRGGRRE